VAVVAAVAVAGDLAAVRAVVVAAARAVVQAAVQAVGLAVARVTTAGPETAAPVAPLTAVAKVAICSRM
jgi:hypothetical protein